MSSWADRSGAATYAAIMESALTSVAFGLPASTRRACRRRQLSFDRLTRCAPRPGHGRTVVTDHLRRIPVLAAVPRAAASRSSRRARRSRGPPWPGWCSPGQAHPRRSRPSTRCGEAQRSRCLEHRVDHLSGGLPTMQLHELVAGPADPGMQLDQIVLVEPTQPRRLRLGDQGTLLLGQRCHGRLGQAAPRCRGAACAHPRLRRSSLPPRAPRRKYPIRVP